MKIPPDRSFPKGWENFLQRSRDDMENDVCRMDERYQREYRHAAENNVGCHGYSGTLLDGQAFEDQRIEGKPYKVTDGIGNKVFCRGVAEHGDKLQKLDQDSKAEANRSIAEDISLFEYVAEHDAEWGEYEAVHDGVQDDLRFISALASVMKGDQVPCKSLLDRKLLEIDVVAGQHIPVAELQHERPDQYPDVHQHCRQRKTAENRFIMEGRYCAVCISSHNCLRFQRGIFYYQELSFPAFNHSYQPFLLPSAIS